MLLTVINHLKYTAGLETTCFVSARAIEGKPLFFSALSKQTKLDLLWQPAAGSVDALDKTEVSRQLTAAVAVFQRHIGSLPLGVWSADSSWSPDASRALKEVGMKYVAGTRPDMSGTAPNCYPHQADPDAVGWGKLFEQRLLRFPLSKVPASGAESQTSSLTIGTPAWNSASIAKGLVRSNCEDEPPYASLAQRSTFFATTTNWKTLGNNIALAVANFAMAGTQNGQSILPCTYATVLRDVHEQYWKM